MFELFVNNVSKNPILANVKSTHVGREYKIVAYKLIQYCRQINLNASWEDIEISQDTILYGKCQKV